MTFEEQIGALNSFHFFREFTYSKTTFRPRPSDEVELADSIIWLGNILMVYQVKERHSPQTTNSDTEARWFDRTVLKKATSQVRDTLRYLKESSPIEIHNERGHALEINLSDTGELHKLIVYRPDAALPESKSRIKFHHSRTAGIIHVMPAGDYVGVVRTLLTPAEVADYLGFREELISKWGSAVDTVSEQALSGQYLDGDANTSPTDAFIERYQRLDHRLEEWDISGVVSVFPDRMTSSGGPTDYYHIVREIALLKRNELREFKKRFQRSTEDARADRVTLPYRITTPRTNCGFIFIPVTKEMLPHRGNALKNFTLAHKYDQRLPKCIGISIANDTGGYYSIEWCYMEFPWQPQSIMDQMLEENYPFREVKQREVNRYTFTDDV